MKNIDPAQASDIALVELTRSGVNEAYAELWKRHAPAVVTAARYFTGFDPEDVAQEAFLRILQQIQAGRGPDTAFRAYAIMTARNVATNMARDRKSTEITGVDDSAFEAASAEIPGTEAQVLRSAFTQQVFASLPTRWQEVLWYREVEDLPVQEFSTYLGMTENATSALLKRAKEGFKQAWIAANLEPVAGLPPECQWVVDKLPQLVRGKATMHTRRRVTAHFETCARCAILSEQSEQLHSRLAMVLLPALLGGAGATGYLASSQWGAATAGGAPVFDPAAASSLAPFTAPPAEPALAPLAPGDPVAALAGGTVSKIVGVPLAALAVGALAVSIAFTVAASPGSSPAAVELQAEGPKHPQTAPSERDAGDGEPSGKGAGANDAGDRGADADGVSDDGVSGGGATAGDDSAGDGDGASGENGAETGDDGSASAPTSIAYAPLSGAPIDGVEPGVFPRLVGLGASQATIDLTFANEYGEAVTRTVAADLQGRWAASTVPLMGQVTVTGRQAYTMADGDRVDAEVVLGTFAVGWGLDIAVDIESAQSTRIRVTGVTGETRNQVVNIESTAVGTLAARQVATAPGEVVLIVPYARASLGDLHYWQGDTSEGPRRVWWRQL